MIALKNVSKTYQRTQQDSASAPALNIFDKLSLTFTEQKSHAILGKSGSGKTTLLSLLAGLDRPDSGEIWMGEQNITTLNESQLADFRRDHIGIIFQQFYLMTRLTAFENVYLPLELQQKDRSTDRERALTLLTRVGLAERKNHFPSQLSGGECQRVAIARALIAKPQLILADEPTGNLDEDTAAQITQDLFKIVKEENTTLILVTHDTDLAARCDHVWKLEHGRFQ